VSSTFQSARVNSLAVQVPNLKGRQMKNLGNATDPQDAVPLSQLQAAIAGLATSTGTAVAQVSAASVNSNPVYRLSLNGTIGIASDVCPREFILLTTTPTVARVDLKNAPTGASAVFKIYQNSTLWLTLTMTATSTSIVATVAQLTAAGAITLGNYWRVDITAVGTTFPGSSMTVTIQ
jgi:hypothetical protein